MWEQEHLIFYQNNFPSRFNKKFLCIYKDQVIHAPSKFHSFMVKKRHRNEIIINASIQFRLLYVWRVRTYLHNYYFFLDAISMGHKNDLMQKIKLPNQKYYQIIW